MMRMNDRKSLPILVVLALMLTCPVPCEARDTLIWAIGTPDEDYAELAIPGRWELYRGRFGRGVVFSVGTDEPASAWPYVHPGPVDVWGGSRSHEFRIRFNITAPPEGIYMLHISLVAAHNRSPPKFRVILNNREKEFFPAPGPGDAPLRSAEDGQPQDLSLVFGAPMLKEGDNEIVLKTISGSWLIYDAVELFRLDGVPPTTGFRVEPSPLFLHGDAGPCRLVNVYVEGSPLFGGGTLEVEASGERRGLGIPPDPMGRTRFQLLLPESMTDKDVDACFRLGAREKIFEKTVKIPPARKWVLYFLHHTHLDIGYTHTQEEVEARQMRFLDEALELARRTKDYPPEARFKWLPEGLWPVESYLEAADSEKRADFLEAAKRGSIGLDALYGNALTGLYSEEELFELVGYAVRLSAAHGLTIDTAMISDVPGYTWGLVPALAHNGVKYLSMGPNSGHRIGYTLSAYGDKPFWWISPSGRQRVLCWMAGHGYSWFHTGMNTAREDELIKSKRTVERLLGYLDRLEESGYPYDMVQVRYNIGADNGPPDPSLPDFVKEWNEKYAYPKLVIATSKEMFRAFEERYGKDLPELRGDFTPYWEDGAASTARDTAVNRSAGERVLQAQALFAMLDPKRYPAEQVDAAWRAMVLYDEHTWGAWNSISDPDNPFVKTQAAWKSQCARTADAISRKLVREALTRYAPSEEGADIVYVFNTCSWPRTDLVLLEKEEFPDGDLVKDSLGNPVASQRLSTGELAFLAADVPSFGARQYTLHPEEAHAAGKAVARDGKLFNDLIRLEVDPQSGAVASWKAEGMPRDLVDTEKHEGLNEYIYVEGRDCHDKRHVKGPVRISVKEPGPLVASLMIESGAPGCNGLTREIRIAAGSNRVDVIDTLDRKKIRTPEGIHLAFPWNIPEGEIRIDTPWAVVRPEKDQLKGANKDYFAVQRWVDVSNRDYGVTWATLDAPMIEVGEITMDVRSRGGRWRKKIDSTQTFYSYVMNNYWETNYAADQEGKTVFRYSMKPHKRYDPPSAHRFGMERGRPLIAVTTDGKSPLPPPLLTVEPDSALVTSLKPSRDGTALMIRLFNVSGRPEDAWVKFNEAKPKTVRRSSLKEEKGARANGALRMKGGEIVTLRADAGIFFPKRKN